MSRELSAIIVGTAVSPPLRSVLAVNSGSSSLKFALFTLAATPQALCRGTVAESGEGAAAQLLDDVAAHMEKYPLAAIGHRVVHGGPALRDPQVVTAALLQMLTELVRFAPNH